VDEVRVLITGGTGFIGRHLTRLLLDKGWEVYVLSRKDRFTEDYPFKDEVNLATADLLDPEKVREVVKNVLPEVVIHMAALTAVRKSFKEPNLFMRVNYGGTVNLVEALRDYQPSLFLFYSTAETYFSSDTPHTEDEPIGGETPYAISKAAAELYVRYAVKAGYLNKVVIVRPCNVYDRSIMRDIEESRGYFVEKAIIGMLENKKYLAFGNPTSTRTWMHVEDHVSAINAILEHGGERGIITTNISGEEHYECWHIVTMLKSITNYKGSILWYNSECMRPYDPPCLTLAEGRFLREIGWKPRLNILDGLKKAVENWRRVLSEEGEKASSR